MNLLKKTLTVLALGATSLTVFSQTNIVLSNTAPYYSISNIVLTGAGQLIANDQINGGQTFSAVNGTNNLGQPIQPVGVNKSRYVAFGFTVTTTNSVGANYTAIVQGSTGFGDWLSLTPSLIATTTSANGVTTTVSTNATYDTGGLILFRVKSVQSADTPTTNATYSVSFSSKPGI
jgi:hypothetical protein